MHALSLGGHQGASSREVEQKWPRRQGPCAEREVVESQGLKHHPRAPSQAYICPIMLEWTASCPARFSPPRPSPHLLPSWAPGPTQCASVAGMSDYKAGVRPLFLLLDLFSPPHGQAGVFQVPGDRDRPGPINSRKPK